MSQLKSWIFSKNNNYKNIYNLVFKIIVPQS